MKRMRTVYIVMAGLVVVGVLGVASACLDSVAETAAGDGEVPMFEVDPFWPQPLPNHLLLGSTIGVSVDSRDHVWIIHRGGDAGRR